MSKQVMLSALRARALHARSHVWQSCCVAKHEFSDAVQPHLLREGS